jgi:hypothetical protein
VVAFANPELWQVDDRKDLGDIWQAARVAGVKPGTIRVWVSRGKVSPLLDGPGGDLFHLPTVLEASKVRPGRPKAA